jgi:Ca2+-binding RTX toxin-like protein
MHHNIHSLGETIVMTMNSNKTLSSIFAAFAALMIFAAVATAATIDDDDVGHNLRGTNSVDTINGNGGNDHINAKRGADTINAGLGDDVVLAGDGADTVDGDIIFANRGRDESWGDDGNDTLWALARGDVHSRHDTNGDSLHGGAGDDTFRTRDGEQDLIDCGDGNDTAILDHKDKIVDATDANPNGSCETVTRKSRAAAEDQEVVNP